MTATPTAATPTLATPVLRGRSGAYIASRASIPGRPAEWRRLRDDEGHHIVSSWIDEDGPGQTLDFSQLWMRVEREIAGAQRLVLYAEPGDFPLKGALTEVGLAIANQIPVIVVAPGVELEPRTYRPLGSWAAHPLVSFADTMAEALATAPTAPTAATPTPEELAAIRDRADAATPGPWLPSGHGFQVLTGDSWNSICEFHVDAQWEDGRRAATHQANAFFVGRARTDVPRLLDLVEALRAENERLTKERDAILSSLSEDQAERLEHDKISKDNLRILDYIADKIGLPHDVELDEGNFCTWFAGQEARATTAEAALAAMTAERDEARRECLSARLIGEVRAEKAEADRAASLERERVMREALTKPGVILFLDGRNEHGIHVLPMPMQTADITTNGDDLHEDAEAITQAAEAAGYPVGSGVWCEFRKVKGQYDDLGQCELEPHWEFVGINLTMTEMFGWHAAAALAKEATDGR